MRTLWHRDKKYIIPAALIVCVLLAFALLSRSPDIQTMGEGDTNFTNVVASGDITAGDDLNVGDDALVTGDLTVSGDTSLGDLSVGNDLNVTGNTVMTGTLSVTGDTNATNIIASGYITATGAITTNSRALVETLIFDTTYSNGDHTESLVYWDDTEKTLAIDLADGTGVTAQLSQELHAYVRNNTGSQIDDGDVVYITGATGNRPTIALAQSNLITTSHLLGVATHDIGNNENGYVTTFGIVRNIDTSDFAEGSMLFLDSATAGVLTSTMPSTGFPVEVATTLQSHATQGVILVETTHLPAFGDISNGNYTYFETDGTTVFTGDALVWDDLRVPLSQGKVAGANVPAFEQIGTSGTYAYNFDDNDEIWFTAQMPHSYDLETTIYPHIHWGPETDVDPSDNVGMGLECAWAKINTDVDSSTVYTREVPTGVDNQYAHLIHDVPSGGWSGTGIDSVSSIINCRFYRFAAATDNYGAGIFVYEVDFHYQIDTVGSRGVTTK